MNRVEKPRHSGGAAKAIGAATALAACMVAAMPAAYASPMETTGQQLAQAGQVDFDIPAQPLTGALTMFGDQADLQVTVDTTILAGRTAAAVSGRMSAEAGLQRLLAGTGIVWRFVDTTTILLEKHTVGGAMTLDPVAVEGAAPGQTTESAYGPVQGYVARRTSTATKSDAEILTTPQSISVVGTQEMEARNVQTLEDAVKYAPGVRLSYGATADPRTGWFELRGFETNDYLVDGLKVAARDVGWQRTDPYLVERVEMLRGPASVMYGQSVPGGVINMVSKRPQETQRGEAAAEYGSFGWKRLEGDITGPLTEDKRWLYRVVAAVQDSDGLNGIDHDKNNLKLFAPSLTWKPEGGTAITLMVLHQEEESRGWWPRIRYRTAAGEGSASTYLGEPDYDRYELKQTQVTAMVDHEFSDRLKFSSTVRYANLDLDSRQMWLDSVKADGVTMGRNVTTADYNTDKNYAIDAHLQGKVATGALNHLLTGGVDYAYFRSKKFDGWTNNDSPINLFSPSYGSYTTPAGNEIWQTPHVTRQFGVYGQDQVSIADKWFFLLGGRQDMAGVAYSSEYQSTFTGRLGLAYKTDFGVVPYASYAESFEPQSGTDRLGKRFEPTTGRQYEAGVKYEPPGMDAVATLAVFDLRKQNVTTPDPANVMYRVQTGEVSSKGVEVGLTMGLAEGLNAVASYTYNPMEVTKSNVAGEVGRQMRDRPIHTASLWMDYGFQDGPLGGFGFGGGLRFVGKTVDQAGTVSSSPYVQDEYMVRYELDDWRLSLNVKNLFDRDVEYQCSSTANAEYCYLQEPLTLTARLARRF